MTYDLSQLTKLGIDYDDAATLRRISMTLHRWYELECGDGNDYRSWAIERDEKTDKPYLVSHWYYNQACPQRSITRNLIADRERAAERRLARIMAKYPTLDTYLQTDPRGCALYILRPGDVPEGQSADSYYSRGVAVYK